MSLNIPSNPAPGGYVKRPQEYTDAIEKARALHAELIASSEWEDAGEREDVKISKIINPEDAYGIPMTRGETIIEGAKPSQVLAAIQLPGIRMKWDSRLELGHIISRFSPSSYELYSVMKSPSYFIWARDIVAVQEQTVSADGKKVEMVQVSVEDEENLPDAGSYQKSRTRATVDISGWKLEADGDNVKASYIVKVHLNGNIPTAVVSQIALDTPMCVGRVRDVFYNTGHCPFELTTHNSDGYVTSEHKTVSVTQAFEDGDGTEATAGERKWTGSYLGVGADKVSWAYDSKRMYPGGINVEVAGAAASAATASVDEAKGVFTVELTDDCKDKEFDVIVTPK